MAMSNEEKLLKDRIVHMLSYKRKSITKISEGNESLRIKLCRQLNPEKDTTVSFDTLYTLLYMFPDIDANWLILGEGPMTKATDRPNIINHNEVNGSTAGGSINVGNSNIPVPVQALLEEKDKRIAELEKDKTQLQGILSVFTSQAEAVAPKKK